MNEIIKLCNRKYLMRIKSLPLIGHIAFGIIDRGTNILQIRPTTLCPLNCIFCSVDAGPLSKYRQTEYIVDRKLLVNWVKAVTKYKGEVIEALIDGVGDPLTYAEIVELVRDLKKFIPRVALETHGASLSKELIDKLANAGLDRINLSIDTLDYEKAKYLQGTEWFNIHKVIKLAEYITKETPIDLHITPVWLPGINDQDIEEIIEWSLNIGAGKKFPPLGIQKYVRHKYGRKIKGLKEVSWKDFEKFLEKLEAKYGIPLLWKRLDFGIKYVRKLPTKFRVGEIVEVEVKGPGWLYSEVLTVDKDYNYVITVVGVENVSLRKKLKAKILRNKDNIYVAKRV